MLDIRESNMQNKWCHGAENDTLTLHGNSELISKIINIYYNSLEVQYHGNIPSRNSLKFSSSSLSLLAPFRAAIFELLGSKYREEQKKCHGDDAKEELQ